MLKIKKLKQYQGKKWKNQDQRIILAIYRWRNFQSVQPSMRKILVNVKLSLIHQKIAKNLTMCESFLCSRKYDDLLYYTFFIYFYNTQQFAFYSNIIMEKQNSNSLQKPSFFNRPRRSDRKQQNNTSVFTYCQQDRLNKQIFVGYIQLQSFTIQIRRSKAKQIQLKQQLQSLSKMIQLNKNLLQTFLNYKIWVIDEKINLQDDKLRKILVYIAQANAVEQLKILHKTPITMLMISHIKFHNLKKLQIRTPISSIQPLTWLDMPNLTIFQIQNCQTPLKILSKTSWKNLKCFHLSNKGDPDLKLNRLQMHKSGIMSGSFINPIFPNDMILQDLSPLAKFKTKTRWISALIQRIPQIKVVEALQRSIYTKISDDSSDSQN